MKKFRLIKIKRKDATIEGKEPVSKEFVVKVNASIPRSHKMCR